MRIVSACLIIVLWSTQITSLSSFGGDNGEQPGEIVAEQPGQDRYEGRQGGEPGDRENNGESNSSTQSAAPTTDGLRMSVEVGETQPADDVVFRVSIENVGPEDALLNLGEMLGNGRALLPDAIRLTLTDADGESRELHFSDRRFPGVAGRVDDYVVPLRAGSVHTLRLSLGNFWCPDTQEFQMRLKPGVWTVRAAFTGTAAEHLNSGTEGVSTYRFWTGRLESAGVRFQIGDEG